MNFLKKYNRNRWNLAFFPESKIEEVFSGDYSSVEWMTYTYTDRWFADPFILKISDNFIIVLAEELSYDTNKGRIAKLIIERQTYCLLEMKIILELDTHLSFPIIFRRGEEVIIIPENSESGKSIAYKYNPNDDSIVEIATVCDMPLTDVTIFDDGFDKFLLATRLPDSNGNELTIFNFDGDKLSATNPRIVKFNSPVARNAGCPIKIDDDWYRPAQDCKDAYGKRVILQKMSYDVNKDILSFSNWKTLSPFTFHYHLGLHTLNCHDGMCVIDARGLLHPYIGRIVRPIINLINKIR